MAPYLTRAIRSLDDFYARGVLDSVRFDRTIDRIAATMEYAKGSIGHQGPSFLLPRRTPNLIWYEPQTTGGIYFQPASTLFETGLYFSGSTLPLDSVTRTAEAVWRYATFTEGTGASAGKRFPLWLYDFFWNGAGVPVTAPWKSGLAQGLALSVFTNLYVRTKDTLWLSRARQTALSMAVPWHEGGVLLVDAQGAWWEEYAPVTRIWNGNVFALLAVADYIKVNPSDTAMAALYPKGLSAARHYALEYDTGTWLRYSRNEAAINEGYRGIYVTLAHRLWLQTGDPLWDQLATKWNTYTNPAGNLIPLSQSVPSDLHSVLMTPPGAQPSHQ
ncbi:MAG: D-glucuronyl C5-epimerase family protein [bacterium]